MTKSLGQLLRNLYFNFWEFWLNPKCRECGERTRMIEQHWVYEHAGDEWRAR
jgi:hypothetical protein